MTVRIAVVGHAGVEPALKHLAWPSSMRRIVESWLGEPVELIELRASTLSRAADEARQLPPGGIDAALLALSSEAWAREGSETLRRNLAKVALALSRAAPAVILSTPTPITSDYAERVSYLDYLRAAARLRAAAGVVKEAADATGAAVADLHSALSRSPGLPRLVRGAELTPAGHSAAAPLVAKAVLRLLGVVDFPDVELLDLLRVYGDGRHNAFTDLARWRGAYYIAFRNASSHFDPKAAEGKILVLRSADLRRWRRVAVLHVEGWDNRDPKLHPVGDRLYLFTQSWSPEERTHRTFMFCTDDGESWEGPYDCGEYVFWRPRRLAGWTYVAAYTGWDGEDWEVHLLRSKDCMRWELVTVMHRGECVNETDLLFDGDEAVAFARRECGPRTTLLLRSRYPFTKWEAEDLGVIVQSPALLRHEGRLLLSGRLLDGGQGVPPRTAVLDATRGSPKLLIELPSGGDNAYPGMVGLGEGLLAISYYSSHEEATNVYLALLHLR